MYKRQVTQGTTVTAAAAGTVTRAGWYGDYGYCVDITHSNGTMTRYGHLSSVKVSVGQSVSQGQAIAASGNTGYSTGPHPVSYTHLDVYKRQASYFFTQE